jgi:hypothetical protein
MNEDGRVIRVRSIVTPKTVITRQVNNVREHKHLENQLSEKAEQLKRIEFKDEAELEATLRRRPNKIEDGFRFLINQPQFAPSQKRLDILGADSEGTLTIVELKVKPDEGQLQQALGYLDLVLRKGLSFYREAFPHVPIESKWPRIILVAPDFDPLVINSSRYLNDNIDIKLKRYVAFQMGQVRDIELIDENLEEISKSDLEETPRDKKELIAKVASNSTRELISQTADLIKSLDKGRVVTGLLRYRINFFSEERGLKFAEIYPRKTTEYFIVTWREVDMWQSIKISSLEEAKRLVETKVRAALDYVKQK